jgi:hypothetical protein
MANATPVKTYASNTATMALAITRDTVYYLRRHTLKKRR